jgi:hypothetical protein
MKSKALTYAYIDLRSVGCKSIMTMNFKILSAAVLPKQVEIFTSKRLKNKW